jgi:hypothetical protein
MRKVTLIFGLALGLLANRCVALNFTPQRIVMGGDGPPRERYFFQDGDKRLGFHIDGKMSVSGSSEMAVFRFEGYSSANTRLYPSPSHADVPFNKNGPDSYNAVSRTLLPPGATKVQLAETKLGAISINGWTSLQFTYVYEFYGLTFRCAITFLNFSPTEQFVFQVSAPEESYTNIYSRSYRVLNSLFDLPLNGKSGPS